MNIVLLGIGGCGKGTLVENLKPKFNFDLISVGQLLRDEINSNTVLGKKINQFVTVGKLVDIKTVMLTVKKQLKKCKNDIIIFDGFPRDVIQAEEMDKLCKTDIVLYLELSKEKAQQRIMSREMCSKCGKIINAKEYKGKVCPVCQGKITKRNDDQIVAFETRYNQYISQTYPLVERYKKMGVLHTIDADQAEDGVLQDALKVIYDYNQK